MGERVLPRAPAVPASPQERSNKPAPTTIEADNLSRWLGRLNVRLTACAPTERVTLLNDLLAQPIRLPVQQVHEARLALLARLGQELPANRGELFGR